MRRRFAALSGLAAALSPAPAMAQAAGGSVTSFGVGDWFGLMLRLALVVGVIWGAVYAMRWYTRRVGGERGGAVRALDIVETRSLGPNRALHLVRLGGRAVLIGVTPERINALMEINDPEVLDSLTSTVDGPSRTVPAFSTLLAGFVGGHGLKAGLEAQEAEGTPRVVARATGLLRGLRLPSVMPAASLLPARRPAQAASRQQRQPRQPGMPLMERVLGLLGFTPVESVPQAVERVRAARQAALASAMASQRMAGLAPAGAADGAPVIAPSATQALRALSGYRATQESAGVEPSMGREARIAEAQRAIVAARQKVG